MSLWASAMELPPLPPSVALPHPSLATHSTPPRHHGWTVATLATAWKLAPTRQATRRWAVVEDEHCQAVGAWLRNFVIAKDFCPWAKPAKKLGSAEGSKIRCWCWMKLMLSLGEWRNKHVCNVSGHFCMYIYIYIKDSLFLWSDLFHGSLAMLEIPFMTYITHYHTIITQTKYIYDILDISSDTKHLTLHVTYAYLLNDFMDYLYYQRLPPN